jgi:transposase
LRSGAPWRDFPDSFGPYTTSYIGLFAGDGGVGQVHERPGGAYDAAVQMIDAFIVRVHQHGACINRNRRQSWDGHVAAFRTVQQKINGGAENALFSAVLETRGLQRLSGLPRQHAQP